MTHGHLSDSDLMLYMTSAKVKDTYRDYLDVSLENGYEVLSLSELIQTISHNLGESGIRMTVPDAVLAYLNSRIYMASHSIDEIVAQAEEYRKSTLPKKSI